MIKEKLLVFSTGLYVHLGEKEQQNSCKENNSENYCLKA